MTMEKLYRDLNGYSGGVLVSKETRDGFRWKGPAETRPPMPFVGRYSSTEPGPGHYKLGCTSTSTYSACYSADASRAQHLAMQRAWARFRDSCYDTASIGTALAESRESADLISSRAKQLGSAFLALKRGRFRQFTKLLQVRPLKKDRKTRWTRPKDASSIWLEYWMGWAPMVGDIYSASKVLTREFPDVVITEFASAPFRSSINVKDVVYQHYANHAGVAGVKYQGVVRVTNPNLALAEQLGLTNPAVVAWELVPFSFIVNWFIPVQSMLSSYSFGMGMEVTNQEQTIRTRVAGSELRINEYMQVEWSNDSKATFFSRRVGEFSLPPRLLFDPPSSLSITRAATAIGLLVSIFTKG